MSQPVIEINNLSKVYHIGHEKSAMKGTSTLRDAVGGLAKKPLELLTGHRMKKENFWALKDVSFNIDQGDIVGIIGKNGSGKSTLLKILSRIVDPTNGEIHMRGKVASLLEVGTGFHPELTGRENIFFNGAILGMKRREILAKFDEIVAFSGVEQFLDTPVKYYSSGMYVRLAFAVAAHLEPDILIVDEVLAVGDAEFQKKSLGKMSSVARSGRTVLFVSHNMPTIQKLCNKGVHLMNGQVAKVGTIKQAVDSYMGAHLKSQPKFDLPPPLKTDDLVGYATSVSIFDGKNQAASSIPFGQDWSIEIDFTLRQPVENFIIAAGVKNNTDVPIRTSWSEPKKLSVGNYKAKFDFTDIILETGLYNIELGMSEKGQNLFVSDSQAHFNIEGSSHHDPTILRLSGAGAVLNPAKITINKA